jgi:hypothetical protein
VQRYKALKEEECQQPGLSESGRAERGVSSVDPIYATDLTLLRRLTGAELMTFDGEEEDEVLEGCYGTCDKGPMIRWLLPVPRLRYPQQHSNLQVFA